MKEEPNITYILDLARGDIEFKKKLIDVIKKELPEEIEIYLKNFNTRKFDETAQNVHKLKHKISILGLEKGYELAEKLEKGLKNKIPPHNLHIEFTVLLQVMEDFVAEL